MKRGTNISNKINNLLQSLFKPIDIKPLVVFRIIFGVIMLWEVFRYWTKGWISKYFIDPTFHFKYYGFEWVTPWAGSGMYIHFFILGVLAVFITIGLFYRISAVLFFLGFTYWYLLSQALYLNHLYLVGLISFFDDLCSCKSRILNRCINMAKNKVKKSAFMEFFYYTCTN